MNNSTQNFLIFMAVVSLLFILGDVFLWVNITNGYNASQYQSAYLNQYPEQVRNLKGLSILPILLLVFASFIFIRSAKTKFYQDNHSYYCYSISFNHYLENVYAALSESLILAK